MFASKNKIFSILANNAELVRLVAFDLSVSQPRPVIAGIIKLPSWYIETIVVWEDKLVFGGVHMQNSEGLLAISNLNL